MRAPLSFLAGALLSLLNYLFTAWSVKAWVRGAEQGGRGLYGFFFVLRYVVLLAILGLIVLKTPVDVGYFVAGFLTVLFILVLRRLIFK